MPNVGFEDLSDFFDPTEFAVSVRVVLQNGTIRDILAIFDDPYLNAELGEYELDTTRPRLTCKAADVEGVHRGDVVQIETEIFDILTSPQGDGVGMAMIDLGRRHG